MGVKDVERVCGGRGKIVVAVVAGMECLSNCGRTWPCWTGALCCCGQERSACDRGKRRSDVTGTPAMLPRFIAARLKACPFTPASCLLPPTLIRRCAASSRHTACAWRSACHHTFLWPRSMMPRAGRHGVRDGLRMLRIIVGNRQ